MRSIVPSPPRLTTRSASRGEPCRAPGRRGRAASASSGGIQTVYPCVGQPLGRADGPAPPPRPARGGRRSPRPWSSDRLALDGDRLRRPRPAPSAWTKNSTLPSAPRSGDSIQPMMVAPAAARASIDLDRTRSVHRRVADHAATPPTSGPAGLELRLHQQHESAPGRGARPAAPGSTARSEMNDRSATTRSTGPPIASGVRCRTLARSRTSTRGSLAQARVELAVADVDGDHLRRAALEQAVGEAAGRRAGVEGPRPRDVDPEPLERGVELLAAPPHEAGRRAERARPGRRARPGGTACRRATRRRSRGARRWPPARRCGWRPGPAGRARRRGGGGRSPRSHGGRPAGGRSAAGGLLGRRLLGRGLPPLGRGLLGGRLLRRCPLGRGLLRRGLLGGRLLGRSTFFAVVFLAGRLLGRALLGRRRGGGSTLRWPTSRHRASGCRRGRPGPRPGPRGRTGRHPSTRAAC